MKQIASTALLLLLGAAIVAAGATQPTPLPTIQGTVLAVHPPTGSVDVVTGVGMAFRVVRLSAAPALRSASGGGRAPMDALRRGDVVRVWSHREGKRLVADRIQRIGRP